MSSASNTDFPYHRVADDLRAAVQSGVLKPGEQLRSEWEMAAQYRTSRPTIRRAGSAGAHRSRPAPPATSTSAGGSGAA